MSCGGFGVTKVLLGLHQIGIVGLRQAFAKIDKADFKDRDAILERLMEILGGDNYIPESKTEAYRTALWREYLRHKGEDFSEFYSEVDVTVQGEAGKERDRFVKMLYSVLSDFELKPVITFTERSEEGPRPKLLINGETVIRGNLSRDSFKAAIRKSISDW